MKQTSGDHDLLVTMHEQLRQLTLAVQELKDGTSIKITDHELRIRRLELWVAIAFGVSWAAQFYFNFII